MARRNKLLVLFVLLLTAVLLVSGCFAEREAARRRRKATPTAEPVATQAPAETGTQTDGAMPTAKPGPRTEAQRIADYLFTYGELPDNFLTKLEAQALGWDSRFNYVSDVAPGMSLGGDYFGNYQERLPKVKGRRYYEADCFYIKGRRNEYRIIYSNDGQVWYTEDHYQTFEELFPSEQP